MFNSACGACAKAIGYQEDIRCQRCENAFHVDCVRATVPGNEAAALWNCQACDPISSGGQAQSAGEPTQRPYSKTDRASLVNTSLNIIHFEQIMAQFSKLNAAVGDCNSKIAETHGMLAQQGILISECRDDITALKEENTELRHRVAFLEEKLHEMTPHRIILEAKDRSERERNVVIWGVPESGDSVVDSRNVVEVLNYITEVPEGGIEAVSRIGRRRGSSSRPMKVRLHSLDLRNAILKCKARLNTSKYKKIYIRSDLTVQQTDMLKAALGELRDREARGEDNLRIVYRNGEPVVMTTRQTRVRKEPPTRSRSRSEASSELHLDTTAARPTADDDFALVHHSLDADLQGSSQVACQSAQSAQDKLKRSREEDDSPKREQGVKVSNQSSDK